MIGSFMTSLIARRLSLFCFSRGEQKSSVQPQEFVRFKKDNNTGLFSFKMIAVHRALLLLVVFVVAVRGNNYEYGNAYSYNAQGGSNGTYNEFSVCSDSMITIDELGISCDSPGTYYYGSGKYRNSQTCQAGDKGKVYVKFYVKEAIQYTAYIAVYVQGYGTVEGVFMHAFDDVCGVSNIYGKGGTTRCTDGLLQAGYYYLQENFYFGSQSDSYQYKFRPKVEVGFTTDPRSDQYDLGGANTGKCSGSLFFNWTTGSDSSLPEALKSFLVTFGILIFCIAATSIAGWYITKRAHANAPAVVKPHLNDAFAYSSEEDLRKQSMLGKNQNLVDT